MFGRLLSWFQSHSPHILKCIERCFPPHTSECLRQINHDGLCKFSKICWIVFIVFFAHLAISYLPSGLPTWLALAADFVLFVSLVFHWMKPDHSQADSSKKEPSDKKNARPRNMVRQNFRLERRRERMIRRIGLAHLHMRGISYSKIMQNKNR